MQNETIRPGADQSTEGQPKSQKTELTKTSELPIGAKVIYGLIGKCEITAVEWRTIGGENTKFYRLEKVRAPIAKTAMPEPAIWVPVNQAIEKGIRAPMVAEQWTQIAALFNEPEFYFNPKDAWLSLKPRLEHCIRLEGIIGLAKVYSFFTAVKRREHVLSTEMNRFHEMVRLLFVREVSDALNLTQKEVEDQSAKALKNKFAADQ